MLLEKELETKIKVNNGENLFSTGNLIKNIPFSYYNSQFLSDFSDIGSKNKINENSEKSLKETIENQIKTKYNLIIPAILIEIQENGKNSVEFFKEDLKNLLSSLGAIKHIEINELIAYVLYEHYLSALLAYNILNEIISTENKNLISVKLFNKEEDEKKQKKVYKMNAKKFKHKKLVGLSSSSRKNKTNSSHKSNRGRFHTNLKSPATFSNTLEIKTKEFSKIEGQEIKSSNLIEKNVHNENNSEYFQKMWQNMNFSSHNSISNNLNLVNYDSGSVSCYPFQNTKKLKSPTNNVTSPSNSAKDNDINNRIYYNFSNYQYLDPFFQVPYQLDAMVYSMPSIPGIPVFQNNAPIFVKENEPSIASGNSIPKQYNKPSFVHADPPIFQTYSYPFYTLKFVCNYAIQIENDSKFRVTKRLIGNKGLTLRKILYDSCIAYNDYTTKIRLRGQGSGYKEGVNHQESEDPLQLCISSLNYFTYSICCLEIEKFLNLIYYDYFNFLFTNKLLTEASPKKILKYEYTVNRY